MLAAYQSTLAPETSMTFFHFSRSLRAAARMSSGIPGSGSKLNSASLAAKSGSRSMDTRVAFIFAITSGEVFACATSPNHAVVVIAGKPASVTVGTSGN